MAMRETVRSIRAYFILSGLLGALSYVRAMASDGNAIAAVFGLVGLALSLAYLYLGIRFRQLLTDAPGQIFLVLKIGAAFLGVVLLLSVAGGAETRGVVTVGFGLLITWYLYANSKRLAAEAQKSSDIAPSSSSIGFD